MLRKAPTLKSTGLQVFGKLRKPLEDYRAAFARRKSGVRIPSAPLLKTAGLQVKPEITVSNLTTNATFVQ
jgi:hypothetical protein